MQVFMRISAVIVIILSIFPTQTIADVKLPAIIGDNMVLQQLKSVPLWGTADVGEKITIKCSWQNSEVSGKADENGKWQVIIKTPKASGSHTITIAGKNIITLNNVLMGEVWLCSGQSNMEWALSGVNNSGDEIKNADYPDVRLFTVRNAISLKPEADCQGSWTFCNPGTACNFSAVGYFFGRMLHKELNVPVGLISADWGGTPVEAWMSKRTLVKFEEYSAILKSLGRSIEEQILEWETQADKAVGTKDNWQTPRLDDSGWKTMELPEKWSATVIGDFDGSVWFRKSVHIPSGWAKKDIAISLGYIDDVSTLYVNGVCIGHTLRSVRHQKHTIAASAIKAGQKNIFAIRVVDIGGDGGIRGAANEMTLRPLNTENAETISLAGTWKYKISAKLSDLPVMPKGVAEINKSTPTSLYNGMIAPLVPLRFAGVIWYQGESNVQRAQQYRDLFPAMIADWRENFGYGDFPFYFVQIAPYNYGGGHSELLREAQFLTLKNTKNTGMAVTSDIGNLHDIHPKNKQDVGKRLALWALAKDYGEKNIEYSGPIYKSFKIEGDKIRLYFDHAKGLKSSNGGLREFIIAGKEKEFRPATAVLEGDTVVVSSDTIKKPAAVRYGWSNMTKPSLFNGTDLPASSFRTDDDISK